LRDLELHKRALAEARSELDALGVHCDDIEGCNDRLRLELERVNIKVRALSLEPDKKPLHMLYWVNPICDDIEGCNDRLRLVLERVNIKVRT